MIQDLLEAGLVEFVAHLVESNTEAGEVLHPLAFVGTGEEIERSITGKTRAASKSLLSEEWPAAGFVDVELS